MEHRHRRARAERPPRAERRRPELGQPGHFPTCRSCPPSGPASSAARKPARGCCSTISTATCNEAFNTGNVTDKLTIDYVGFRWQNPKEPTWPTMGRISWDPTA
jgi:hypothetical protein